jgi:predicted Zn-dependent peptidase
MYEKLTLPNGVRIVFEHMPHVRSAAVGIWVGVGSRNEAAAENGSAHFIEHMLFKGTDQYSAGELAAQMDGIGGQINAYTTRESTCFYARVLDSHLDTAIDLLCGMFFDSRFDQGDVESERGVILEEIGMYDDSPEDMAVERLMAKCFPGALGRPVLGRPATLKAMTGDSLRAFKARHYTPDKLVISLCGSFTDAHIEHLRAWFQGMACPKCPAVRQGRYTPAMTTKRKATEQNHLCLGFPGIASDSDRRFALNLLSTVLGGGMSSRLFQTVRERHGLCYSIYTFSASFADTGLFGVATALGKETEQRALGLIRDELHRIQDEPVGQDELDRAREQVKSSVVMALESTSALMNKLGSSELVLGTCLGPDELIARYDAVMRQDVLDIARELLDFSRASFSAVGRVGAPEEYQLGNKL